MPQPKSSPPTITFIMKDVQSDMKYMTTPEKKNTVDDGLRKITWNKNSQLLGALYAMKK